MMLQDDPRLRESILSVPLVFLDVETTGLSPEEGDRVCEIALVRVRGGREEGFFSSLVNPGCPISPGASAVNGITDAMVQDASPFSRVAGTVLDTLQDSVLVAHNAPFDLGFLRREMFLSGRQLPEFCVVDTLRLARRCFSFFSNSLQAISSALRIEVGEAHRALADARATWGVFAHFLHQWEGQGITRLGQILELQGGPPPFSRSSPP